MRHGVSTRTTCISTCMQTVTSKVINNIFSMNVTRSACVPRPLTLQRPAFAHDVDHAVDDCRVMLLVMMMLMALLLTHCMEVLMQVLRLLMLWIMLWMMVRRLMVTSADAT